MITVSSTGSLSITDCEATGKITHNSGEDGRGISNKNILSLWGGSITGNTADVGGGVYNEAAFYMYGGSITGNTADKNGGGVSITDGTFKISGNVNISSNTLSNGADNNVYLADGRTITVDSDKSLTDTANIGITVESPESQPTVVIGTTSTTSLSSDNTDYVLEPFYNGLKLVSEHTQHCICGSTGCTDSSHSKSLTWQSWTNTDSLPANAGNYYLTKDVTLNAMWECNANVNLCLNGKTITGADGQDVITVSSTGSLNITDCRNSGAIIASYADGVYVYNGAALVLWEGSIETPYSSKSSVLNEGTFAMYGGNITSQQYSVYNSGTFTMIGGNITSQQYGVYNSGTFTMNGGGSITQCACYGVYIADGMFTMNYGSITDGNCGVYIYGGTFKMYGGTITNNCSSGVTYENGSFHISGDVHISGNSKSGVSCNVYLYSGRTITVDWINYHELDKTASVGITAEHPTTWLTVAYASGAEAFFSDNPCYKPISDGGDTVFLWPSWISVTVSGVKLAEYENGGTEMTTGKTYDGKAVAYDASGAGYTPNVSDVNLTYQWQEKGEDDTYSDLNYAPSNVGNYRLLVRAMWSTDELGRLELPFEISPAALTTDNIESSPADVEYDREEHKWVPELADKDGNPFGEGADYDVTYTRDEFVSAGLISVTITGKGNYTGTLTQSYEITAKPLTVGNVAVENKLYDGTNTASFSGTPTLNGVVAGDDVTLVNGTPSFADINIGKNIAINFTAFALDGDDAGNYTLTQPKGITANISAYTATGEEYTSTTSDWTNEDFEVTAADGWKVSTANTADGEWSDSLTRSEETDDDSLTFYVKNTDTGVISEAITKTYKIDKTAPTGEVCIDDRNAWQKFLNTISFNLFYKDEQTVTITASDSASGVGTIGYLLTAEDLDIGALADKTFTDYSNPVGIKPDDKLIAYAKITDKAGNITYLRSDGIVLDATAPVISGATNGSTYCAAVTLTITDDYLYTVQLNGETVSLTDGKLTLAPKAGKQTVTATDKFGNSTTLSITVNDGHSGGTATCIDKAECAVCGEKYGKEDPNNHANLQKIDAVDATVTSYGNIEYWYCDGCKKYFSDENAAKEIKQEDTVIAKLVPSTIKGDEQTVAAGEKKSPKTGDNSPILLWLALLLVSGGAVTATAFVRKKRRAE